jgi:acetyltransferase-like isoleucine patch superfamily enzyme
VKVYLIKTPHLIDPWKKKCFEMSFDGVSLLTRLKKQFLQKNFLVEEIDEGTENNLKDERIVCYAHTYLSDTLIERFINEAKKRKQSLQCSVNKRAILIFSADEDKGQVLLPFYYVMPSQEIKNCLPFICEDQDLFKIHTGLPMAVMRKSNSIVPVNAMVGIAVDDWSNYLLASSLLAREFTLKQLLIFKPFLSNSLLTYLTNLPFISKRIKKIGNNCRIHPTAIIEGSIIGDNVEIGPYCYIRASVIGDNTSIRENSSIKLSVIGKNNFITTANIFNVLLGDECFMFTQLLVNCIIGSRNFIGGGSGFSDFDFFKDQAVIELSEGRKETLHKFLASAVGDDCMIGAGLIFKPGNMIPNQSSFINKNMIDQIPQSEGQLFLVNQGKLLSIPKEFLKK